MLRRSARCALMTLCLVGMFASEASALKFTPFSNVKDVCPKCPKATTDTITFQNNVKVKARIIAETNAFYVIERYGEVRLVPLSDILSIDWGGGSKPAGLTSQDQIVLLNGHVLTGSIIDEKDAPKGGYFRMRSSTNNQTYIVFKKQAESVYKGGRAYTFTRGS